MKDKFAALGFPYKAKENGECEKLQDNKCTVYENRPDICSVDKTYENEYKSTGMSKEQYYLANAKVCNAFIKEDNLDEKFLIDEKQYS